MMKYSTNYLLYIFCLLLSLGKSQAILANEPDSAYVFAYAPSSAGKASGLYYAWSIDRKTWHSVEPECRFLRSDYGPWSQKKIYSPSLTKGGDGFWHVVWQVNKTDPTFACAKSTDLIHWFPQSFPIMQYGDNCLSPKIAWLASEDRYVISWYGNLLGKDKYYSTYTKNFKEYSIVSETDKMPLSICDTVLIGNNEEKGTILCVSWKEIETLMRYAQACAYKKTLYGERVVQSELRLVGQQPLKATLSINEKDSKKISDKLIGIFFEDINYSADGGLYAELIQNRGFEYSLSRSWKADSFWRLKGKNATFKIATEQPLHKNNPHYAILTTDGKGAALQNEGFGGIAVKAGEKYNFSLFARTMKGKNGKLRIRLVDETGIVVAEATTEMLTEHWKQHAVTLKGLKTTLKGRLEIIPLIEGSIAIDMVSLFPQHTFKGRKNGLRADLAKVLADIKPRFVRFPGGCVVHGNGIENMYHWKNTIGPLETRKPQANIWGYHQSMGLGFYEYFQFCEDIGALPLPVVPAGVPCQNSERQQHEIAGQQGGVPMKEMDLFVQDILDLIEWANGDPKTNKWAKMRAEAGHPKPFGLKYLGVGNEDMMSDVFEKRFAMIYKAVKEKYPEILVVGTVGAGDAEELYDYTRGWEFATELGVPIVDEHYYKSPGWFLNKQDYYDRYDRRKSKVYVGEYAVHLPDRANNMETALVEALYLTNLERNGDVVEMASYAPLLAKKGNTQWKPDLIYFTNAEVETTVDYDVQKLFGNNVGNEYISSTWEVTGKENTDIRKRIGASVVRCSQTGETIIKLVNLLPVEIHTSLVGLDMNNATIERSVLHGQPDDTLATVKKETIFGQKNTIILPKYSFTVLRIKKK